MAVGRVSLLLRDREFRRTLWRRIAWRLHWMFRAKKPLVVPGYRELRTTLARSSASAGIYINRGFSDHSIARIFEDFLEAGMVVFDCGAHIGEYTLMFAALVGDDGAVHAFEPDPRVFTYLETNVAQNDLRNVVLNNYALSDYVGFAELALADDPTISSLRTGGEQLSGHRAGTIVHVTTIDAYAAAKGLNQVAAAKIDVEGAEAALLDGATRLLTTSPPRLLFVESEGSENPSALAESLRGFGYDVSITTEDHLFPHIVARLRRG